ncbi:unnamed protein product [Symbiodinium natans]|uniref:Ester cyclase n=1 Tax=Symbiodinium natans TaxID=878477 RepID=A0A812UJP1_9DINO|nr:unnamed protein product [Symbiodinium natans]
MSTIQEANKARIREFVQVVQNQQDVEACDRFFSPDFVNPDIEKVLATGKGETESFKDHVDGDKVLHRMLFRAFPDIRVSILDMAADGDKVWTMKRFQGTHLGPWMDVQPTGRSMCFEVVDIMRLQDGMIMDHQMVSTFERMVEHLRA